MKKSSKEVEMNLRKEIIKKKNSIEESYNNKYNVKTNDTNMNETR